MKTDDFDFTLPDGLIAQRPAEPRDRARLLGVLGPAPDGIHDKTVRDLPSLFRPGDALVINNTKVIPSRLFGRRGDARVEVTLHKQAASTPTEQKWWAFARPAKRLRAGDVVDFADGLDAKVEDRLGAEALLLFKTDPASFFHALDAQGAMPLPPYIDRKEGPREEDRDHYQTVFAARPGAVAAPTASLHFTDALLREIEAQGVERVETTLHVGAGTFLPVKTEDPRDHMMHGEWFEMTPEAAARLNAVRAKGGRIIAAGTTAMRVLESIADEDGTIRAETGETHLFILPGYRFKAVDALITNFHLPKSTLFMLVCAFAGTETMKAAYAHAVAERYRFFSYGDGSFLLREDLQENRHENRHEDRQ